MAAHTERMERFENTIFKQREEINGRMTEMFGLLKELTTSRTPEKVLIREEAKFPVTKNVNSISLTKGDEEGSNRTKVTPDNAEKLTETETETPVMEVEKINEVENGTAKTSIKFDTGKITLRSGKHKLEMGEKVNASLGKGDGCLINGGAKFSKACIPLLLQPRKEWMTKEKSRKDVLYLMRRSLEVLRKFHWMILGGRFNQLSHVSSPLLSKPEEY
ncbi:hypothetical protein Tco_0919038 [Tanacetum coccineum]